MVALELFDHLNAAPEQVLISLEGLDFLLQLRHLLLLAVLLGNLLVQGLDVSLNHIVVDAEHQHSQAHRDNKKDQLQATRNGHLPLDLGTRPTQKVNANHASSKLLRPRPTQTDSRGAIS